MKGQRREGGREGSKQGNNEMKVASSFPFLQENLIHLLNLSDVQVSLLLLLNLLFRVISSSSSSPVFGLSRHPRHDYREHQHNKAREKGSSSVINKSEHTSHHPHEHHQTRNRRMSTNHNNERGLEKDKPASSGLSLLDILLMF